MFRLIALSFLVFSTTAIWAESARQVRYQAENLFAANSPPTFDNGFLVVYGLDTPSVYTRDGALAYNIPSREGHYIPHVAVDTDQTAAAAVNFGGIRGSIAVFDRTGSQVRVIETGQYLPSFICFAPDHSIWATGKWVRRSLADKREFFILRHFSRDGKELGAFLPRSDFKDDGEPAADVLGLSCLRIANNRIGAFLTFEGNHHKALWLEADLSGKEIGRWSADLDGGPVAFTSSGAVYARVDEGVFLLDHGSGKWSPVSIRSEGYLLGADGDALVFVARGTPELQWVPLDPH